MIDSYPQARSPVQRTLPGLFEFEYVGGHDIPPFPFAKMQERLSGYLSDPGAWDTGHCLLEILCFGAGHGNYKSALRFGE